MTRADYEKLPKPENGMWLTEMQTMADELNEMFTKIDQGVLPDPNPDKLMEGLIEKAGEALNKIDRPDDLDFLYYTYWACMEECEMWEATTREKKEELRSEGMLRTQVLVAWLFAIKRRIDLLGGKIEVA